MSDRLGAVVRAMNGRGVRNIAAKPWNVLESFQDSQRCSKLTRLTVSNIYKSTQNVSGYVCNHGSPSGERDTASPRGRYGERLQRDSCLKIHM